MLNSEQRPENVHFSFWPNSELYLPSYKNWHSQRIFHSFDKYLLRAHYTPGSGDIALNKRDLVHAVKMFPAQQTRQIRSTHRMSTCTRNLVK